MDQIEVMMKKRILVLFLLVFPVLAFSVVRVSAALVRLGAPPPSQASAAQTITVNFGGTLGLIYEPSSIFIATGDTVQWDGDFTSHPLVSDDGLWSMVSSGTIFTFTFNTPGVYHFHCFFHGGLGMDGVVLVGHHVFIADVMK